MTERPILFSDAMVRAILSGTKTQTRRAVKDQPDVVDERPRGLLHEWGFYLGAYPGAGSVVRCPYGVPGDRLWVREAWRPEELADCTDGVRFRADDGFRPIENAPAAADRWLEAHGGIAAVEAGTVARWRPSIHMPRWASRLTLEVTDVRVERVQAIGPFDAGAEGAVFAKQQWSNVELPRDSFRILWDSLNGERVGCSWADDPWVWVVGFRRLEVSR